MRPGDAQRSDGERPTALEDAIGPADVFHSGVNGLYSAGLSIAAVLSRRDIDDHVRGHLYDALEALDGVIADLRTATFGRLVDEGETLPVRRHLYRTDREAFAYARRDEFLRARDHSEWAHEREGLLHSARSGEPFARRAGNVFYDIASNLPLYVEGSHAHPAPRPPSVPAPATTSDRPGTTLEGVIE